MQAHLSLPPEVKDHSRQDDGHRNMDRGVLAGRKLLSVPLGRRSLDVLVELHLSDVLGPTQFKVIDALLRGSFAARPGVDRDNVKNVAGGPIN